MTEQSEHTHLKTKKNSDLDIDYGDFQGKIDTKFLVIVYHIIIMVIFPNHRIFISPMTIVLA